MDAHCDKWKAANLAASGVSMQPGGEEGTEVSSAQKETVDLAEEDGGAAAPEGRGRPVRAGAGKGLARLVAQEQRADSTSPPPGTVFGGGGAAATVEVVLQGMQPVLPPKKKPTPAEGASDVVELNLGADGLYDIDAVYRAMAANDVFRPFDSRSLHYISGDTVLFVRTSDQLTKGIKFLLSNKRKERPKFCVNLDPLLLPQQPAAAAGGKAGGKPAATNVTQKSRCAPAPLPAPNPAPLLSRAAQSADFAPM